MSFGRFRWVTLCAMTALLGVVNACSSDDPPNDDHTGATGGAATGGTSAGGTSSGGDSAGGTASGGANTGGTWDPNGPPQWLSETGLFESDMVTLAAGVEEFAPQFVLWSDDAAKRRWVSLPAGSQIDTTDMDFWTYPVGTRLWKEFTRDGVRVETRLLEKRPDGTWWMMAYQWNADLTDAEARPMGVADASGTPHDIPSQDDCAACHGKMKDTSLGFTAIQLSHSGPGVTLTSLIDRGALTANPPGGPFTVPGSTEDKAMLGYLHANCGTCHNQKSPLIIARTNIQFWLLTGTLGTREETPTFTTAVNQDVNLTNEGPPDATKRIDPGSPATSAAFLRFNTRSDSFQMPPLGTEDLDTGARDQFEAWINGL